VNSNRSYGSRSKRSHRARRRLKRALFAAAVIVAAVFGALAFRSVHRPTSAILAVATPYPQVHPAPVPIPWTNAQVDRLATQVETAFAPALAGARRWSLCVMDPSGRVLFSRDARVALTAASVQKLIVATTALDVLGSAYRYETLLVATANPTGATIPGDVWLVGSGDPSLRSRDLRAAAQALYRSGVREIAGRLVVDGSAFRGPEINPYWNPNDANEDYQAPVSAISLDDGTIEFDVRGTSPGAAALARMKPWSDAVHATGDVTTVVSGGDPDVVVAALGTPNTFALSGVIPTGAAQRVWVPIHGAVHYAGAVFAHILRRDGIVMGGDPAVGAAPAQRVVLWDHRSASLRVLLRHMLYESDNHYAEQLLRTLGGGDNARGLAVERSDLRSRHIPTPNLHLVDGSGLADANRVAALTLATLLVRALSDPMEQGFYDLLPQGGKDGTLDDYDFAAARGRVRAKTGHLSGVSSLAGYVATRHHGTAVFAFTIDGSPGDPDDAMVSAVNRISEF
jgi:D-alanyl-D-alanine carboxypeptidase/D-alanyl-D-alanine-endopeptidase (penicillin-binding protein 4)